MLHAREQYVQKAVDEAKVATPEFRILQVDALRRAWQAGFDASRSVPHVLMDHEQLTRAVIAGIRCYRSHHYWTDAARGLDGYEVTSLAKRIVGELISLGTGDGFSHGIPQSARCQCGHRARRHRGDRSLQCAAPLCSCTAFAFAVEEAEEQTTTLICTACNTHVEWDAWRGECPECGNGTMREAPIAVNVRPMPLTEPVLVDAVDPVAATGHEPSTRDSPSSSFSSMPLPLPPSSSQEQP